MASVTITLSNICPGGEHLTFSVTGDITKTVQVTREQILAAVTDEDKDSFCKGIAKLAKIGRTNAQALALLQAGVTVTV